MDTDLPSNGALMSQPLFDYDTDQDENPDDVPSPSPTPPAPRLARTNDELNLAVLRRHNTEVESIVSLAPFAVVYSFVGNTQQWEKSGIEGTLFVCKLSAPLGVPGLERYAVIVLNRRGLENFSAELFQSDGVELTTEYIILQAPGPEQEPAIFGIWIFSDPPPSSTAKAREFNAQAIQNCAAQAEASQKLAAERGYC
jgi:hypothetical protein